MTPTINVNMKQCDCPDRGRRDIRAYGRHESKGCAAYPVLIPCPIPRSVTFEVRMGECVGCQRSRARARDGVIRHGERCPAHPIRVACSIGGETWEESEVTVCEPPADDVARFAVIDDAYAKAYAACRGRWALVKALVLGTGTSGEIWQKHHDLVAQRDAVYAALADMARSEEAVWQAQERACRTMEPTFIPDNFMNEEPHSRPSASILERYVERLVEQVGVLP